MNITTTPHVISRSLRRSLAARPALLARPLLLLAPVLAALGAATAGCLDPAGKDACGKPDDCVDGFACISFACQPGDRSLSDTDGDGLTDVEEDAGWTVIVDEQGFGLAAAAEFLARRDVTSDPFVADTDADGLGDRAELLDRSDPRRADSDGDGLGDRLEKEQWRSNVLSVDSDGDARDAEGVTIPLAALFDGAELEAGTSPTLADTDGDGKDDREERDSAVRDPRVAEIPQALIEVVGELTVQMNVEYTDETTTSVTYGDSYSTTDGTRTAFTDMESTAVTFAASSGGEGFFDDLEFSKEGAIKFFGGKALELGRSAACQARTSDQVAFDSDDPSLLEEAVGAVEGLVGDIFNGTGLSDGPLCEAPSPETTNTTSTTLTQESTRSATQSYSEYRTEAQTRTETAATGTVTIGLSIRNVGISTFELVNPTLTMMQWIASPSPDAATGAGAFRTLATLAPVDGGVIDENGNRTFTLAPDDPPVIVQVENRDVNADFIKSFLARPQAIFFSPASFVLNDQNGVSFEFLTEETFARTATLAIDDGVAPTQRFQIATNVERAPDGALLGARMGDVLRDVLGVPFETRAVERVGEDGATVVVDELERIGDLANQRAADRGDPENGVAGDSEGVWIIYVKRAEQALATLPFEEIRILPGDEVRLVYVRDIDGDGLMEREELVYGSDDGEPDSDGDGLSDFVEVKVGWDVQIAYLDATGAPASVAYRVTADPTLDDADGDGLADPAERAAGTDPNNPDTDDDGRFDACEQAPLDADDAATNGACDPEPRAVFVTRDAVNLNVHVLATDTAGALAELPGSPFATGTGNATQVAFSPDGAHAWIGAGRNGSQPVHAFDLDEVTFAPALNPFPQLVQSGSLPDWDAVVAHPSGAFVYAVDADNDGGRVHAYGVNQTDQPGRLAEIDADSTLSGCHVLAMDPLGRYLLAFAGDELAVYDLAAPGTLDGRLVLVENGPGASGPFALPAFANRVAFGAAGDVIYAISGTGLYAFDFDRSTGDLTAVAGSPFAGSGGAVLSVDPAGRFLYTASASTVFLHRINSATGTVALVDIDDDALNGVTGVAHAGVSDVATDGVGALLYATGPTSTASFSIEPTSGLLTPVASTPVGGDRVAVLSLVR